MISKRIFLAALDCDTAGWYHARAAAEPPGPGLEWQFYTGNAIGELARNQLGAGRLLPFAPVEFAERTTREAIADPQATLLFEATFVAGQCIARADALRRCNDGWEVIEAKSALLPKEGKVKSEHVDDLAYTVFVAEASGLRVSKCTLMFLDRASRYESVRMVELDVTEVVRSRAGELAARAPGIVAACNAEARPEPVLKLCCKDCDFFAEECIGKGIDDHLFILPRLSPKRFDEMKEFQRLTAVPETVQLTEIQQRIFVATRSGQPLVDLDVLQQLDDVVWPVYYLDFEAVAPALPWFHETAPYDTIPFQYSIHVCDRPGHEIAYHAYLADHAADWREDLVASMIRDLGTSGSIAMYTDYEEKCIKGMAAILPQFAPQLEAIIARLVDLEPLVGKGYVHPGFRGRTSIKNVLPVIAPDLSYTNMDVGNGLDAAGLFALIRVGRRDPRDHGTFREQLLEYCKLDTLAMVRLHAALHQLRPAGDRNG